MMADVKPHIAVVIPNWNGAHHLPECLTSLREQSLKPVEVIVVDNGSSDGTLALLASSFPEVRVIRLLENRGFAVAVNEGIRASEGEYILLLNNDTCLDRDCMRHLRERMEDPEQWASVGCRMVNYFDHSLIDSAGDMITRSGLIAPRGHGEPNDGRYTMREEVFGACAGAAMYRRSLFDHIGGFDEDFVSYFEDADLSFRARLAGHRCVYEPQAICYHKRGATGDVIATGYPLRMMERNLPQYIIKNLPGALLLRLLPILLAVRARHVFDATRRGSLAVVLGGMREGAGLLWKALRKRRDIQSLRTVSTSELMRWIRRKG
jgi:GT2 family glycosyltransferase